jgi:uncharacterized protein
MLYLNKSLKKIAAIEITLGLILIFGYLWIIFPLYSPWRHLLPSIIFFSLLFFSKYFHQETFKKQGINWENWDTVSKTLLPFTIIAILFTTFIWLNFFTIDFNFASNEKFWLNLLKYPPWAFLQQYILLAFFFKRLKNIFSSPYLSMLLTAILFSLIHFPNPALMSGCFLGGLFWSYAYDKNCNLFSIAISHTLLGVLFANVFCAYTIVGPWADIRWTRQGTIHAWIDSINEKVPNPDKLSIISQKDRKNLLISGWAASATKQKIEEIYIRIDKKDYLVESKLERHDVGNFYKSDKYRNSGYRISIPLAEFQPGPHVIRLKVRLSGNKYWNYPTDKFWFISKKED